MAEKENAKSNTRKWRILKFLSLSFILGCAVYILVLWGMGRITFPLFSGGTESYEYGRLPYFIAKCAVCGLVSCFLCVTAYMLKIKITRP